MLLEGLIRNKEKRRQLAHILAGVVILIHAYDKYESHHGSPVFFTISGLVFLTIAVFHPLLEKRAPWLDGVFFIIEGILSLVVAYDYYHAGKIALPTAYLLVSVLQFYKAVRKSKTGIEQHKINY